MFNIIESNSYLFHIATFCSICLCPIYKFTKSCGKVIANHQAKHESGYAQSVLLTSIWSGKAVEATGDRVLTFCNDVYKGKTPTCEVYFSDKQKTKLKLLI